MDEFVTELEKLRREHAREFDGVPMEYSPALCVRIVDYVRGEKVRDGPPRSDHLIETAPSSGR